MSTSYINNPHIRYDRSAATKRHKPVVNRLENSKTKRSLLPGSQTPAQVGKNTFMASWTDGLTTSLPMGKQVDVQSI